MEAAATYVFDCMKTEIEKLTLRNEEEERDAKSAHPKKQEITKEETREAVGGTSNISLLHHKKYKKEAVSIMPLMFFVPFQSLNMDPVQLTGLHHCLQQLSAAREIKRIGIKKI